MGELMNNKSDKITIEVDVTMTNILNVEHIVDIYNLFKEAVN